MPTSAAPFLQQVAESLHRRYGKGISALTLVFPGRRARLYFAEHLLRLTGTPLGQPKADSMDDIFARLSGLTAASPYRLMAELYGAYKKHRPTEETFDRFYAWGEVMLADFDAIDKYMVRPEALLRNVAALKNAGSGLDFLSEEQRAVVQSFWKSVGENGGGGLRDGFVSLWSALLPTYHELRRALREKGCGYPGMVHREGAEALQRGAAGVGSERLVFIGFNALTECEKVLFRQLKKAGSAEFFWDYDGYYMASRHQEAGLFMRENVREFPPAELPDESASPFSEEKDIQVVAAPSDVLQAKLLPTLLAEVCPGQAFDRRTAVVLADEGLLIPALYSLPPGVEALNVTMGYPLTHTPAYSLVELLVRAQQHARVQGDQPPKLYHKDVLAVLQHPYVRAVAGEEARALCAKITGQNRVYVSAQDVSGAEEGGAPSLLGSLFAACSTPAELVGMLQRALAAVAGSEEGGAGEEGALRREYVVQASRAIGRLSEALSESGMALSMAVFMSLLRSALQGVRIPFEGEPIAGLQVMGMLETHLLDFENLVVLSLGEDIFPRGRMAPSLLPYSLRRCFGLPALEQHEAMYAYYFYRLLQRARRVRLVYNSQATDSSTGEMSRYLRQLAMESPHAVPTRSVSYSVSYTRPKPIAVEKTGEVAAALSAYLDGGARALSASTLNSYMACPLRFYFEKIARLHAPEEVAEEVDGRTLGNIFHLTMQQLYAPLLGCASTEKEVGALLGNKERIALLAERNTALLFFGSEGEAPEVQRNGKLLMVKEAVARYAATTLAHDLLHALPFTIAGLEEPVNGEVAVAAGGRRRTARLTGTIDRRDARPHGTCIVDYKTGSADESKTRFASVEALFSGSAKERRPEVFQAFLYALLAQKEHRHAAIQPALYFVRSMYKSGFDSRVKVKTGRGYEAVTDAAPLLPRFEELLQGKLAELFDTARPFVQADEEEACRLCPFGEICHK